MANISRLGVVLGLDSAEFNAGLGKAEGSLSKFATAAKGTAAVAIAAMAYEFINSAKQAISFADAINDVAKANDLAVSTVIEFSQALQVSGGSSEAASRALSALTNKIDEAVEGSQKVRDRFKEVGVSVKDLGSLSEEQLLRKTVAGLAAIEDPIKRNALAFDLLGKSVRGVDIKGFNEELKKTKGSAEASDEAFGKIGNAIDRIDKLSFQIKTDLANNLADPFDKAVTAAENFYRRLAELREQNVKEGEKARQKIVGSGENIPNWWKNIFGSTFEKELKEAESKVNVFSAKMQEKIIPSILGNGLQGNAPTGTPVRDVKVSDEQQKILDKIKAQKEALGQNILTITRQTEELRGTKSLAEQLAQEFLKGGKYAHLANDPLKEQLLNLAKTYDKEKERVDLQKEAIQMALMRNQHDMDFRRKLEDLSTQKDRLDLEREMAGASDTQREKMLAIFDLEKDIVKLKKEDKLVTQEQIDEYRRLGMERINADEANKRAQKTFEAGWSRAWENYKERAMDSSMIAGEAFSTVTNGMSNALDSFVSKGKISFSSLIGSMIQDLLKLYMKAQMSNIFGGLFSGLFGGGSGGVSATAGAYGIESNPFLNGFGFADGGEPPVGRVSLVGERGPELFIPKTSGTIIPNNQLSNVIGNNQPSVVYNAPVVQNMSAIDTQSAMQFLSKYKDGVWAANQSANRSMPMSR